MVRVQRFERPGGSYHITARGNKRGDSLREHTDSFHFLEEARGGTLGAVCRSPRGLGVGCCSF